MAFVGYKTEEDATKALEYFNNTFVDTSKISVEYARAVKSTTLPRPWSRHSRYTRVLRSHSMCSQMVQLWLQSRQDRIMSGTAVRCTAPIDCV